ncbi:unnamed protein product [Urochloa decumbens]|uniref:Transcription repressor n=1 Tax=Urochloa decumbens TaxID=240449 RepID=A0ABC9F9I1_9POAL
MSSWFYKLRRKHRIAGGEPDDEGLSNKQPVAPAPSPCSPNRASYYVPSRERAGSAPWRGREDNPKVRDTHFPRSPQPSDIIFDVVVARRDDRFKDMPELKLRPILTRPAGGAAMAADSSSSAAASPTARVRRPRFHAPPQTRRRKAAALPTAEEEEDDEACARRRRRRRSRVRWWMCESVVVVKESAEPEEDFLESMAAMIAANGVRSPRGLEDLLACYLALNAPDHHRAIVAAFRRAWMRLHSIPPPSPAARGTLQARSTAGLIS